MMSVVDYSRAAEADEDATAHVLHALQPLRGLKVKFLQRGRLKRCLS